MSAMSAFGQAVAWTTLVGFLFLVWLGVKPASLERTFEWRYNLWHVVNSLQSVWAVIALGLSVAALIAATLTMSENASAQTVNCAVAAPSQTAAAPAGSANELTPTACGASTAAPLGPFRSTYNTSRAPSSFAGLSLGAPTATPLGLPTW